MAVALSLNQLLKTYYLEGELESKPLLPKGDINNPQKVTTHTMVANNGMKFKYKANSYEVPEGGRSSVAKTAVGIFSLVNSLEASTRLINKIRNGVPDNGVSDKVLLEISTDLGLILDTVGTITEGISQGVIADNTVRFGSAAATKGGWSTVLALGKGLAVSGAVILIFVDLYKMGNAAYRGQFGLATTHGLIIAASVVLYYASKGVKWYKFGGPKGWIATGAIVGLQFVVSFFSDETKIIEMKTWLERSRFGPWTKGETPCQTFHVQGGGFMAPFVAHNHGSFFEGNAPRGHKDFIIKLPYESLAKEIAAFKDLGIIE